MKEKEIHGKTYRSCEEVARRLVFAGVCCGFGGTHDLPQWTHVSKPQVTQNKPENVEKETGN